MAGTFRDILTKEGALTFYRGISSPILAEAPKRAVKFSTNEQVSQGGWGFALSSRSMLAA